MSLLIVLGYVLLVIFGFLSLFIVALGLGTIIPVNRKFRPIKNGIDIFVTTNGMHIDFIVPTRNKLRDWTQIIDSQGFKKKLLDYPYLGIGWGAPEFYLELESWDNLPFDIAFRALAIPSSTIMHVIGYDELPVEELKVKKISISSNQYIDLCRFISSSFKRNEQNDLLLIPDVGYTENDNFYHAHGVYHLFHTCNYWINKGLKQIGVYAPIWSPLDKGILYQLDRLDAKTRATAEKTLPIQIKAEEVLQ